MYHTLSQTKNHNAIKDDEVSPIEFQSEKNYISHTPSKTITAKIIVLKSLIIIKYYWGCNSDPSIKENLISLIKCKVIMILLNVPKKRKTNEFTECTNE